MLARFARAATAASTAAAVTLLAHAAHAALAVGVAPSTLKVRPADTPTLAPSASIKAARNELEAFQIVVRATGADVAGVSAKLSASLVGPGGAKIPDANVVLYTARYYDVAVPSNDEGATGPWPDALVPDTDTYFGEKRNAFPLTVPTNETRVIWVDVLVPIDQRAGDYAGAIEVDVGGAMQASVPIALHVGNFTLPSTASLASAYGMGYASAAQAHCGGATYPYCATEDAANAIRALYLRAALDHRFTISASDFQPPFGGSLAPYEKYVLPLVSGTGSTRLPGAKLTTVLLDGGNASAGQWIAYAKSKGFFDRLFYYPIDEPGTNATAWSTFLTASSALHAADPAARICLTTSMQDAQTHSAADAIDIFVPVLDQMYGRPGSSYVGDQRSKYDAWLAAKPNRKLWMYQSCDQHGCGSCGTPSPGVEYTGWPERVIDSSGVQDRAFGWVAWQEKVTGELYFAVDYQLATAWDAGGQCAFSGSGDGTIFYPGKPSVVGGTKDIPIESIRMKMIREGMEDYEYLTMVAAIDPTLAQSTAAGLFATPYQCAKSPAELDAARGKLFAALDVSAGDGGGDAGVGDAGGDAGAGDAGGDAASGGGGCACGVASRSGDATGAVALAVIAAIVRRRRRDGCAPGARRA